MELDGTDLAFVSLADERERQTLCEPRFAGARRALKDEILPGRQPFEQAFYFMAFEEASIVDDIRDLIRLAFICRDRGIVGHAIDDGSVVRWLWFAAEVSGCE